MWEKAGAAAPASAAIQWGGRPGKWAHSWSFLSINGTPSFSSVRNLDKDL